MSERKSFFDGDPRMMFVFGLVTGIAIMALLGGGISVDAFAKNNNSGVVREFNNGNTGNTGNTGTGTAPSGELAAVTGDEHIRGDLKKAKVVLVEYSDFECPFCSRHHPTMKQIVEEYGDEVAWVYRHFPLSSIHPNATAAAQASECAAEQGKFWEYGDALIENYQQLSNAKYQEIAEDVGLNMSKFNDCYDSKKYASEVSEDYASGQTAGVTGTPATFVNGQLVSGAVPYETLKQIIDSEIAAAE